MMIFVIDAHMVPDLGVAQATVQLETYEFSVMLRCQVKDARISKAQVQGWCAYPHKAQLLAEVDLWSPRVVNAIEDALWQS